MAAFRLVFFPPSSNTHLLLSCGLPPKPCPFFLPLKLQLQRHNLCLHLLTPHVGAQPIAQSVNYGDNFVEEEVSRTKILVQNVPWTCTENDIRPLFQKYGTVIEIEFSMYNKARNRGLAFVTMGSPEEAVAAFNSLESSELEGRVLKLNWAKPKKKKPVPQPKPKPLPVHNLFVANLPFQARPKDLKEFFNSNDANVVSAEIIFLENPRKSAGYGFVSFNKKSEADAALTAFQGKEFMGRPIRVAPSRRFLRAETKAAIQLESPEVT